MPRRLTEPHAFDRRLRVEVLSGPDGRAALIADVQDGLLRPQKRLPPKYFYDEAGSRLFDRICDTEEYYLTRTEQAMLAELSLGFIEHVQPTHIVEFGSGAARKTRCLLSAAERRRLRACYVPFDVSHSMLVESSHRLLAEYSWLTIHGVVGDYEKYVHRIPRGQRRLLTFIGGTIGNFEHDHAVRFLGAVAGQMNDEDHLLLGADLVKDHTVLHAAYNDAQGITAAFNKNVLRVLNRELDADFSIDRFGHVAFFDAQQSRIEMHLRSEVDQSVSIQALDMVVRFSRGETIHTEISRKFTRNSLTETLHAAGLELVEWHTDPRAYFALSLSRRVR